MAARVSVPSNCKITVPKYPGVLLGHCTSERMNFRIKALAVVLYDGIMRKVSLELLNIVLAIVGRHMRKCSKGSAMPNHLQTRYGKPRREENGA